MTSREVAEKFGVTVATIYNWCNKGIIKPARVNPNGRKVFDDEEIQKLYDAGLEEVDRS